MLTVLNPLLSPGSLTHIDFFENKDTLCRIDGTEFAFKKRGYVQETPWRESTHRTTSCFILMSQTAQVVYNPSRGGLAPASHTADDYNASPPARCHSFAPLATCPRSVRLNGALAGPARNPATGCGSQVCAFPGVCTAFFRSNIRLSSR